MGIENVIKKIHVEPINRKAEYEAARFLTREEVTAAMDRVADQVRCNMEYFGTRFPSSATRNQAYGIIDRYRMDGRILDRTSVAVPRVHRGGCL